MNKQKGITLIALVITVVILLILTGIAIVTLGGENGLIAKVNQAKKTQIETEMKEKLTLAISELQTEKEGKATLDDITQEWANNTLQDYDSTVTNDESTNGKKVTMTQNGVTGKYIVDENLNITEILESNSNIEFSYEVLERVDNKVSILIHVKDEENGLSRIEFPDQDAIIVLDNKKEEKAIDYQVETGIEYKIKITSESGEVREEIIYIEPEIEITEPIIATTTTATSSVADSSQTRGTILYINFSATLKEIDCTITLKDDISKTVPYEITSNGTYIFIVTGTYNGKTITKEIEIVVNKYKAATGLVKYDAGDWTQEEIENLKTAGLYNLNANSEASSASGLNFTFGGFTNKESTDATNSNIVTSKNMSVKIGYDGYVPNYDGWKILESTQSNGKTYVTKIVHAGCPENFVYYYTAGGDAQRAEYILSSGLRQQGYNTYSPRSWQMYIDESQKDLIADTTDKDGNTIKDIHVMTYSEAYAITGSSSSTTELRKTGSEYWTGTADIINDVWYVNIYGAIRYGSYRSRGVRPVVSLKSGVYIASGEGTETSPYVLGIE